MPAPKTRWEESVDRAMRSCTRVFGEGESALVAYQHASGLTYTLDGIFESATETVDLDTGASTLSYQPRVSFPLSAMQALPEVGDTCVIRDQAYRVVEPQFDGQGTVTLRLHEA
jgi:hypothetical protein